MLIEFILALIISIIFIILSFKLYNMYTKKRLSKKYPIGSGYMFKEPIEEKENKNKESSFIVESKD